MSWGTIVVLVIVALICIPAVRHMKRTWSGGGGCHGGGSAPSKKVIVKDTDEANYPYEIEVKISGMTCLNCVNNVENALNALGGTYARVDLDEGRARVLSKEPLDREAVERAITDAGYYVVKTR